MAEENQNKSYETTSEVEINDRGVFDYFGKKKEEEKPQEEVIVTEFDQKVNVSGKPETKVYEKKEEEHGEEKKHSLLEELHRSDSISSSSSDEEEVGEDGEKKKKKKKERKGLQEKFDEEDDKEEKKKHEETAVPVEKVEVVDPEHQKGFLDKIKEKLPGHHNKTEEVVVPPTSSTEYGGGHGHTETSAAVAHEGEAKEKKGILEKIKEKLPGYHPKTDEEKEEKESGAH